MHKIHPMNLSQTNIRIRITIPITPIKKFEDAEQKKPKSEHVSVDPENPSTPIPLIKTSQRKLAEKRLSDMLPGLLAN